MSNFTNVTIGKQAEGLDVSPQFQAYSGVEIIVDDDTSYFEGNESGRVLRIENPWGSRVQAQDILAKLQNRGLQYQPYTAQKTLLNPAAELGDAVTINGHYSGIYRISRTYSPLISADIDAPQDDEVDHEYPYEPKQERIFKREISEAFARITVNTNKIESEVSRAEGVEGHLSSLITQTASEINATVSTKLNKSGGSSSSFGWTLTDSSWQLKSNNSTVFKATASGVEVKGKITATSGYIGNGSSGFAITSSSIYNGMNSLNSSANGVYIGTNGISVGGGKFKVTSSGVVSAADMTLTGRLTIGGTTIDASVLRSGAQSAYSNGTRWSTGAGYGYDYNDATKPSATKYPAYFTCGRLIASSLILGGYHCSFSTVTIDGVQYRILKGI